MSKLFYCCLPVLLLSMQHHVIQGKSTILAQGWNDSSEIVIDSNDIRIFLACKKTILYTINNITVATDKQEKDKKYIDGYEILGSSKMGYKNALSLKTFLLDHNNYTTEISRCSFFPKYCLSFSSRYGSLHFFLPENSTCNVITIVKISSIDNKETEFSFAKEILDKIKTTNL